MPARRKTIATIRRSAYPPAPRGTGPAAVHPQTDPSRPAVLPRQALLVPPSGDSRSRTSPWPDRPGPSFSLSRRTKKCFNHIGCRFLVANLVFRRSFVRVRCTLHTEADNGLLSCHCKHYHLVHNRGRRYLYHFANPASYSRRATLTALAPPKAFQNLVRPLPHHTVWVL